eukprot:TRINITY_DN9946_c0_g1_i1.p1 TRINITY_DN9946_c0_g1~~TRINITY_DN9946_c0_g1_i1.p1  ORF type:complete len:308 (-),score=106.40 TRINITY_DN9946_c0_g1_i1:349-1272(-)
MPKRKVPVGTPKNAETDVKESKSFAKYAGLALLAAFVAVALSFRSSLVSQPALNQDIVVARATPDAPQRLRWNVTCDAQYQPAKGCTPSQCARVLRDNFVSVDEVQQLRDIAERIMRSGGGSGGPTIFDLNSGALSKGDKFIDLYTQLKNGGQPSPFSEPDRLLLLEVLERVKAAVVDEFGVAPSRLWLTTPTFFSRIRSDAVAVTMNDEYWHEHIDRIAYGSFVYSSLIYLSDYGTDFEGGEFVFVDGQRTHTIHPAKGRFHLFTSGSENVHYVAKVTRGVRHALTIAFTCDKAKGVDDFLSKSRF